MIHPHSTETSRVAAVFEQLASDHPTGIVDFDAVDVSHRDVEDSMWKTTREYPTRVVDFDAVDVSHRDVEDSMWKTTRESLPWVPWGT